MNFEELGFRDSILRGIKKSGYTSPTPIQEQVIPPAIQGKDILGSAETGSGKTAAFMLPVMQQMPGHQQRPRCLVLEPTRELAIQVKDVAEELGCFTKLKTAVLFGGAPASRQCTILAEGVDIVVATPGRLIDMAWNGSVELDEISHLVVDEVDRMLDMGFIDDVKTIISYLPRTPFQKMFFSATLPKEVMHVIDSYLVDPEVISIGRRSKPAEGISHELYIMEYANKFDALTKIIKSRKMDSTIVFTETKHGADKLTEQLKKRGIESIPFHSGYEQMRRYDILRRFRQGKVKILVATNVAARGLDITGISHIFNFDVPSSTEDYVHRIGRSARADAKGVAITFASPSEARKVFAIEKLIEMKLPVMQLEGLTLEEFPPQRGRGGGSRGGSGYKARGKGGPRSGGPKGGGGKGGPRSSGGPKSGGGKSYRGKKGGGGGNPRSGGSGRSGGPKK